MQSLLSLMMQELYVLKLRLQDSLPLTPIICQKLTDDWSLFRVF